MSYWSEPTKLNSSYCNSRITRSSSLSTPAPASYPISKLNSSYSRIVRSSGLSTRAPASRPISQDTLRRWEKSVRESTYICNQAAGSSRCLSKVQSGMQAQLTVIQDKQSKGKSSEMISTATDELQYVLNFNRSITQCMGKTMEHLSEFVFINVANMTLTRRDAYLRQSRH